MEYAKAECARVISEPFASGGDYDCTLAISRVPEDHELAAQLLADLTGRRWLAIALGANWPGKKWLRRIGSINAVYFETSVENAALRADAKE